MRVSHKYKFLYISIARTGSSSVRNALNPFSDILDGPYFPFYYHVKARELKETFLQKGWPWEEYYKFTFVRNPFERMYSQYRLLYSDWFDFLGVKKHPTFCQWIQNSEDYYSRILKSYRLRLWKLFSRGQARDKKEAMIKHLERLWKPAVNSVFDEKGNQLLDYIGRHEKIEDDFRLICEKIGLPEVHLPFKDLAAAGENKSLLDYRKAYDEKSKTIVLDKFRVDFEKFKYPQDIL